VGVNQDHHDTHPKAKEETLQEANDTSR